MIRGSGKSLPGVRGYVGNVDPGPGKTSWRSPEMYHQCLCNRLRCPLARLSGLQCFNMGHNAHGINLYGFVMILWEINMQADNLT